MLRNTMSGLSGAIKTFIASIILLASINTLDARSSAINIASLDERISLARNSFEDVYYELVKQGFFDVYYNNNLIAPEREVLLYLIDWLDKRNDRDSRYLLKKLNKYLYLEFYQTLCAVDAQKNQNGTLLHTFKGIFKSKVGTPSGVIAPYRAELSKMATLISMINSTKQPYEKKREAMAYILDKTENKILAINASLIEKGIADADIKVFIRTLQAFITNEPIIKPSMVKGVVITSIVIACLAGASFTTWKYVIPQWDEVLDWADVKLQRAAEKILKPFGKQIGESMTAGVLAKLETQKADLLILVKQMGKDIADALVTQMKEKELGAQLGRDLLKGLTRDEGGEPNPDTTRFGKLLGDALAEALARNPSMEPLVHRLGIAITNGLTRNEAGGINPMIEELGDRLGNALSNALASNRNLEPLLQRLGTSITTGLVHNEEGELNPNLEELGHRIGHSMIHGLATSEAGEPNPDLDIIAEHLGNYLVRGLARDNHGKPNPDIDLLAERLGRFIRAGITPHPIDALTGYGKKALSTTAGYGMKALRHVPLVKSMLPDEKAEGDAAAEPQE